MKVSLRWITPDADKEVAYIARVSNPNAVPGAPAAKLIKYLLDHKEISPFEMVCMCVEIQTTRDISRQILRHRSFHFQEFSQRYSVVDETPEFSGTRLQDTKNRQSSIPTEDKFISAEWSYLQSTVWDFCWGAYKVALALGIAKELARKLLPEGLTRTRMYMQGTLRDWLFYTSLRTSPATQKEHRSIAWVVYHYIQEQCPDIFEAAVTAGILPELAEE